MMLIFKIIMVRSFVNLKKNNLHLVGYSQTINKELSFKELKKKIYFDKSYPNSIPYVTSYYKKDWGFCMRYNDFIKLDKRKKYRVYIDSKFSKGKMHYSELLIKGKSKKRNINCVLHMPPFNGKQ